MEPTIASNERVRKSLTQHPTQQHVNNHSPYSDDCRHYIRHTPAFVNTDKQTTINSSSGYESLNRGQPHALAISNFHNLFSDNFDERTSSCTSFLLLTTSSLSHHHSYPYENSVCCTASTGCCGNFLLTTHLQTSGGIHCFTGIDRMLFSLVNLQCRAC